MVPAHLERILKNRVLVSSRTGAVVLKERHVQKVEVSKLASDAVVVKLDRVGTLSGLDRGPWRRVCDYMLVYRVKNKTRVLFVELKKTLNRNKNKPFQQLRWSLPLFGYLGSVCELHFGPEFDQQEKEVRYVLICDRISRRFDKQSVKAIHLPYRKQYEDIMVTIFIGPRFGFNQLWNGRLREQVSQSIQV